MPTPPSTIQGQPAPGSPARPGAVGSAWAVLRGTFEEFLEDNCFRLGAALAYYSIFSLAPLLLIVIGIAGWFLGREAVQTGLLTELRSHVGETGVKAIEAMLAGSDRGRQGLWSTIAGAVMLVIGASGVFVQLKDALNTVWEVKPAPGSGLWRALKARFSAFALVIGVGFLLLVSLVLSATLAAAARRLDASFSMPALVMHSLHFFLSFAIITALFAAMYKVLPDVKLAWRHVVAGAVITALLFNAGKFLLGLYLGRAAVASTFGAFGALVVVLLWAYYSSLIFLFGAELTQVRTRRVAREHVAPDHAVPVSEKARAQEGIPHQDRVASKG